jgi:hypothetical protein
MTDFNLAETFATFLRNSSELIEQDIEDDLQTSLDNLIDKLAVSPESIQDEDNLNTMLYILK